MNTDEYLSQFNLKTRILPWSGDEAPDSKQIKIEDIKGLVPLSVIATKHKDEYKDFEEVLFEFDDKIVRLYHEQDCCEFVWIESIVGNLEDLVGNPLLLAEESTGDYEKAGDSGTWTFYKFATIKGYVDIRFIGESNGYYSESVYIAEYQKIKE